MNKVAELLNVILKIDDNIWAFLNIIFNNVRDSDEKVTKFKLQRYKSMALVGFLFLQSFMPLTAILFGICLVAYYVIFKTLNKKMLLYKMSVIYVWVFLPYLVYQLLITEKEKLSFELISSSVREYMKSIFNFGSFNIVKGMFSCLLIMFLFRVWDYLHKTPNQIAIEAEEEEEEIETFIEKPE